MQDLRDAIRALRAAPVVSAVAILSLALGIGANTAIFSIVNSLLLRSLPVRDPERLVMLNTPREGTASWTYPFWEEVRKRRSLVDGAVAYSSPRFNVARSGQTDFVEGLYVNGEFFDVLGVPAILGRTLASSDDRRRGGPDGPVAVISYSYWQRRFGGAATAIGSQITLERVPFTIVGVTPPSFFGPVVGREFDVAVPFGTEPLLRARSGLDERRFWWIEIMLRLKPGQTMESATTAWRGVQPQIRDATMPPDGAATGPRRVSEGTISSDVRERRRLICAHAIRKAGACPHGCCRARTPDCVREHREPDARPFRGPPARARRTRGARRIATAPGQAAARRERRSRSHRRRHGPRVRAMGRPAPRATDVDDEPAAFPRPRDGLAPARVHHGGRDADSRRVRHGAGIPRDASKGERCAEGLRARFRERGTIRVRESSRRRSDRTVPDPRSRRGPLRRNIRPSRNARPRVRQRPRARDAGQCAAQLDEGGPAVTRSPV